MNLSRLSLLSVTLYSALLVVLFWWGSTISETDYAFDLQTLGVELWSVPRIFFGIEIDTNSFIAKIVGSFLTFIISLEVARLAIKGVVYLERTYMPSVIFVLISSSYYSATSSIPILFSTLLMVLAFTTLFKGYLIKHIITKHIFIASIDIGLAVLILPATIYLTPLLFLYLALFRGGDIREWVTALVGILLPMALGFLYLWVFDFGSLEKSFNILKTTLQLNNGSVGRLISGELSLVHYLFIGIVLLLFVLAMLRFSRLHKSYKRRSALGLRFFIYFSLWVAVVIFISPIRSLYLLPLLAFPLAVVIPSYYATKQSNWFSNLLYFALLLSAIGIHLQGWLGSFELFL